MSPHSRPQTLRGTRGRHGLAGTLLVGATKGIRVAPAGVRPLCAAGSVANSHLGDGIAALGSILTWQTSYSPALTGKIDETTTFNSGDFRNIVPRFTPEARKANQALVDLLRSIAEKKHATHSPGSSPRSHGSSPSLGTSKLERLQAKHRRRRHRTHT
jgi:hypothetical protein